MFTCVPHWVWKLKGHFQNKFSPSTAWTLGLELRSWSLGTCALTHWAVPPALTLQKYCPFSLENTEHNPGEIISHFQVHLYWEWALLTETEKGPAVSQQLNIIARHQNRTSKCGWEAFPKLDFLHRHSCVLFVCFFFFIDILGSRVF